MLLAISSFLHLTLVDILDILMVAAIIYFVFKWMRGTSAVNVFIAVIALLVIKVIVSALNMKMMSNLLDTVIDVGVIALIIIFQPEIRRFLLKLGNGSGIAGGSRSLLGRFLGLSEGHLDSKSVDEIIEAASQMSAEKTGALIVICRQNSLEHIIETGDRLDSAIKDRLIENLFFKNSPLHDGAVIIRNDRIVAARCTLPITEKALPARYGMRHKAAVGITEESDAEVVVVSEQTGRISYVRNAEIHTCKDAKELKSLLGQEHKEEGE